MICESFRLPSSPTDIWKLLLVGSCLIFETLHIQACSIESQYIISFFGAEPDVGTETSASKEALAFRIYITGSEEEGIFVTYFKTNLGIGILIGGGWVEGTELAEQVSDVYPKD